MQNKKGNLTNWFRITLIGLGFLVISLGLGYLIQFFLSKYKIPLDIPQWIALLIIFGVLVVINVSILPLPLGVSIMIVAAQHWNPFLVAFSGSLGASCGELSGYYFGFLGKKVAFSQDTPGYKRVQNMILKYGMWGIAVLSFQPVIPFELAGFVAGIMKMPFRKFFPAIWIGKFPKYLLLIYWGLGMINFLPFLKQ